MFTFTESRDDRFYTSFRWGLTTHTYGCCCDDYMKKCPAISRPNADFLTNKCIYICFLKIFTALIVHQISILPELFEWNPLVTGLLTNAKYCERCFHVMTSPWLLYISLTLIELVYDTMKDSKWLFGENLFKYLLPWYNLMTPTHTTSDALQG